MSAKLDELDDLIAKLQKDRKDLMDQEAKEIATWPKITKYYMHSDKDSNWDLSEKLGLDATGRDMNQGPARTFSYTCLEMELTLEVNQDGTAFVTHFQDQKLPQKVKANS
jgi:hypothetical protein